MRKKIGTECTTRPQAAQWSLATREKGAFYIPSGHIFIHQFTYKNTNISSLFESGS
jgi:hypothetical protein